MKKFWITMIAIVSFGFIASSALAQYWGAPMGGHMNNYYTNTSSNGNYQEFLDNTSQLRQDLAATQGEYNALMVSSNPDSKRAAELGREITSLNDQLRTQAGTYNLQTSSRGHGGGMGHMGGYGAGMMGRGCM